MANNTKKPAGEPVDYLASVRAQLAIVPRSEFMRIAADSDVHLRTVYSLLEKPDLDPRYSTVHALYRTLTNRPTVDRRKAP